MATGLPILITLNNECAEVGGDWRGWASAIEYVANKGQHRIVGVECGNEFDIWGSPSSQRAAELTLEAADILRPVGIPVIGTSVASGVWPQWLAQYSALCRDVVDYFCIHPYGQRPSGWGSPGWFHGDLVNVLNATRDIGGKPVVCTEYGVKIDDAGGPGDVANFLKAAQSTFDSLSFVGPTAWFAWCDQVGAPHERGGQAFGLIAENGAKRPAYFAYAQLPGGTPVEPDSVWQDPIAPGAQFVLGFKQWADAEPGLIGRPHDVREFGAALGMSQQRTTNGLLSWTDLKTGQVMTFLNARDGRRYQWTGTSSQEIIG